MRSRQLGTSFEATLPLFGPPSTIVVGEPENTESAESTPWEIVLMHEHFHQLQYAQPGYFQAVEDLKLSGGDKTGVWMLNYPFPYKVSRVAEAFSSLRNQLLLSLSTPDGNGFTKAAQKYLAMRRRFFSLLSADDHKYFSFQLWQKGIARYTQIRAAEAAAAYLPTAEYQQLPDYSSFAEYAPSLRKRTMEELRVCDIATMGRGVIYPFGAAEAILLDRLNPGWQRDYFHHMLSTDALFTIAARH